MDLEGGRRTINLILASPTNLLSWSKHAKTRVQTSLTICLGEVCGCLLKALPSRIIISNQSSNGLSRVSTLSQASFDMLLNKKSFTSVLLSLAATLGCHSEHLIYCCATSTELIHHFSDCLLCSNYRLQFGTWIMKIQAEL